MPKKDQTPEEEPAKGFSEADVASAEPLRGDIDDRLAALREDHIRMGARDKDDHYQPRP